MSIAIFLKNNLANIPPSLGVLINHIPYAYRPGLGSVYRKRKFEIREYDKFSQKEKKQFILDRIKNLVNYSYKSIKFYTEYYDSMNFSPNHLNNFDDIQRIPIIDKHILSTYNIEDRSAHRSGRYIVNTGGSSGTPFNLYIEPSSMGHEWAHMHTIWEKFGYKPFDLKIVFGGRSDIKNIVDYDVVRNHFAIDIYAEYKLMAQKLKTILSKYTIKYLHGYPSSIYDFATYCKNEDPQLQEMLSKNLKGVFFGSEYPHEHYRNMIEDTFSVKSVSWYGHTERAILAYEKHEKFRYEPFGSYGYTEALNIDEDNYQLIATSYYNFASPLIRYNTQDIVSDIDLDGELLKSFKVTKGREGEFILDKDERKINLTGLIFGRHHELFNYSKFIQVKQVEIGKIEVYFVSDTISNAEQYFDARNLDCDISFIRRDEPIRTTSGKINLLIK